MESKKRDYGNWPRQTPAPALSPKEKALALGAIFKKIDYREDGCWVWTGSCDPYGKYPYGGRQQQAHRVMWQMLNGRIKKRMVLDHLCQNHRCVNVQHLEEVSLSENSRRGARNGLNNRSHPTPPSTQEIEHGR